MNSGDGKDSGELESESDDSLRSPGAPARSGFFGGYTFSGVVHHIVNKFSGVVAKTVSPPPMTAESSTRSQTYVEKGGLDKSSELRDRNDTRPLSLNKMNLRGVSSDGRRVDGVTGGQSDVGVGGGLGRPLTPSFKGVYPQFRKESSILTKSTSNVAIHSPSYSSPFSGPVGQMPVVHLSPRQRPAPLRNNDRAKPVMVKIAQPDQLHTSLIRHRSVEDVNKNNSSNVDKSRLKEAVVDALKKRKRSHLEPDENEISDLEESVQLSKRRCSRDDAVSAPETPMSRGMKRRALHDDFGDTTDAATDQSPDVVEGAVKKICQNSSPPSRRSGCGARNVIDASYSSHLRWEERIMRAKSLSQSRAASSQDESMPLVEDNGPASSRTSRCSSRFSRLSRANSPTHQDEDLRSGHRPHSIQSSDRSTPLNLLPRLHDVDSIHRVPLLVRDGSIKNRVTMLSVTSSSPSITPLTDLESQMAESRELKTPVEFTADDLERDRDLLNSRASRLLLGFFDADDETDSTSTEPSPKTSSVVLGEASTAFQASGAGPASTTLTTGVTDNQVQTNTGSGITSANVLKSKIDSAESTAFLQNPSVSTSKQEQGRSASSIAANPGFNFGSSTGVVNPSASPAISTVAVSSTGTLSTTLDSSGTQLNLGKSLGPSESGLKGFSTGNSSFGTFLVPSSGASDAGKLGSTNSLNGLSFGSSALTTAAGTTTASVVSAFGTAGNVQTTVASFGNTSNTVLTTATSLASAFPALGDTRVTSGFFGSTVGVPSAFGDSAVVTSAATATKDNAQTTAGGFPFGKVSSTQANADNLGSAKPLVVTAQTTASGLSFGNFSTAQPTTNSLTLGNAGAARATANSFAFGNSGITQTTASSFSFPNSGASQTTASSFAFGNSGNTQTTASSSAFGNMGATQTTPSSFSFGNSGLAQTPASSFAFGISGTLQTGTQTTASSFSFGNSGSAQTTANSLAFGNSGSTQTTASNFSFGNSGATQPPAGGFAFGNSSTNLTTGNMPGSVPTTASAFAFGNSSSKQTAGVSFGNSGNAQTTANSSFAGLAATPQFSFGKSSVPTTANPSTAGGFAFGNVQQTQASGSNLTTANLFGNSIPIANAFGSNLATSNTFGSNTATPNTFGSNATTVNTFGSNAATANTFGSSAATANTFGSSAAAANTFGGNAAIANTFGSNTATANTFGSNTATANTFGSTQPPNPFNSSTTTANPFGGNMATANPFGTPSNNFDNKPSGLQFNRPDVAATNQSTPQDLRRVLFPSTPANNSTQGASLHATPSQQQQPGFNFFGSKTDGNSNNANSAGGFAFGKNSTPAPTFGSNSTVGGFAFGKTAGSNPPQGFTFQGATQPGTNSQMPNTGFGFSAISQPPTNSQTPNTGFNFQGAAQPGTNPQAPSMGFNFNATTPNFAFGQMPNPPANGLPSIASFSAGPKFTPGTTYGSSSTARSLRTKKKGR